MQHEETIEDSLANATKKNMQLALMALEDKYTDNDVSVYSTLPEWDFICVCLKNMEDEVCETEQSCISMFDWLHENHYRSVDEISVFFDRVRNPNVLDKMANSHPRAEELFTIYDLYFRGASVRKYIEYNHLQKFKNSIESYDSKENI